MTIGLDSIEQTSFSEYQLSLVTPTCLCTFGFPDDKAQAFLDLNASLAFAAIHRLLGGSSEFSIESHSFSNLDMALNRKILSVILKDLSDECKGCLQPVMLKKLFGSHLLGKKEAAKEMYLIARHKVHFGHIIGILSLAIPVSMARPFLLSCESRKSLKIVDDAKSVNVEKLEVSVKGLLGDILISRDELKKLEPGDIIDLGRSIHEPIEVVFDNDSLLKGKPGLIGKYRGLQIEEQ
jgi:flagellar motor switch protein FliM